MGKAMLPQPQGPLSDVHALLCDEEVVLVKKYDFVPPDPDWWHAEAFSREGEKPFLLIYFLYPGDRNTAKVYVSRNGTLADEVLSFDAAEKHGLTQPCKALRYVRKFAKSVTKRQARQLWKTARPVVVSRGRPATSTLLVALPHQVFDALVDEARRRGIGPAALIQSLIETMIVAKDR
jgi:hypothetical protein